MTSDNTVAKLDASDHINITLVVFSFMKPTARLVELKSALHFMEILLGFEVSPNVPYVKQ